MTSAVNLLPKLWGSHSHLGPFLLCPWCIPARLWSFLEPAPSEGFSWFSQMPLYFHWLLRWSQWSCRDSLRSLRQIHMKCWLPLYPGSGWPALLLKTNMKSSLFPTLTFNHLLDKRRVHSWPFSHSPHSSFSCPFNRLQKWMPATLFWWLGMEVRDRKLKISSLHTLPYVCISCFVSLFFKHETRSDVSFLC